MAERIKEDRTVGESVDRAHGASGRSPRWGGGGKLKAGEWDPNAGPPKKRGLEEIKGLS